MQRKQNTSTSAKSDACSRSLCVTNQERKPEASAYVLALVLVPLIHGRLMYRC